MQAIQIFPINRFSADEFLAFLAKSAERDDDNKINCNRKHSTHRYVGKSALFYVN